MINEIKLNVSVVKHHPSHRLTLRAQPAVCHSTAQVTAGKFPSSSTTPTKERVSLSLR